MLKTCMCGHDPSLEDVTTFRCPYHIEELIKKGASADIRDDKGMTPLHYITLLENEKCLKLLLSTIPKDNICNFVNSQIYTNWETSLHIECSILRRLEFINILLDNGADPNIQNKTGNTPLHTFFFFISDKHICKSLRVLISYGADFTILNSNGDTPLHVLCRNKIEHIIPLAEIICKEGIHNESIIKSINIQNGEGNTPLQIVCQSFKNIKVCKFFIEKGGDIHIKNNKGKSCLDVLGNDFFFKENLQQFYDECTSLDIKEPDW